MALIFDAWQENRMPTVKRRKELLRIIKRKNPPKRVKI
jgi:hypothetical protein